MFLRLLALFITIPLVELFIFLTLGSKIGIVTTVAIVVLTGFLGAYLTKNQGLRTLLRYQEAVHSGKIPHREIVDGLLILIAGAVLLTPGFLTDAVGFALLVPSFREKVRAFLGAKLKEQVIVASEKVGKKTTAADEMGTISVEAEVIEDKVANQPEPEVIR